MLFVASTVGNLCKLLTSLVSSFLFFFPTSLSLFFGFCEFFDFKSKAKLSGSQECKKPIIITIMEICVCLYGAILRYIHIQLFLLATVARGILVSPALKMGGC